METTDLQSFALSFQARELEKKNCVMHFIASLQLCKYCSCQVQTIVDCDNKSNFKEIFGAAQYTLQLPATTCQLVSKHIFFLLHPVIANESPIGL